MTLLERDPNNTEIDRQLRQYGIDPARVGSLPTCNPNDIPPQYWDVQGIGGNGFVGVIGRPRKMTYLFGRPTALSPAVRNLTGDPITRTLTGETTVGTETSFSVSTTIEGSLFKTVSVSVTTAFSQTWKKEQTFTDSVTATIRPGRMMWLELKPVIRRIEGDFVWFTAVGPRPLDLYRFSGTVEAPGLEGGLKDVIDVRDEPATGGLAEALQSAAQSVDGSSLVHSDGEALTFPGFLAALQSREDKPADSATA